jgi:hypothetical protein
MGRREVHTVFWWANLRETDHLKYVGVCERILLKSIFKKWNGGMDWIYLVQDRKRWGDLMDEARNLRVP